MNYIDAQGQVVDSTTSQDRLLKTLYSHSLGRLLLRPLITKPVSVLGGKVLSTVLSKVLISPFVKANAIDLNQYQAVTYQSYNDFFTRKIRPECRPIDQTPTHLISPSDGKVSVYPIDETSVFTVKHTSYTLKSLLRNSRLADKFNGGYACFVRLTVDDYHRYCYVDQGQKSRDVYIPGVYHTVNPVANEVYPIYKENSRCYTLLRTEHFKDVLFMEVGALMVGKISNHQPQAGYAFNRGEEKGYFEFGGSTIVLLFEKNGAVPRDDLLANTLAGCETKIKMGEWLGHSPETV